MRGAVKTAVNALALHAARTTTPTMSDAPAPVFKKPSARKNFRKRKVDEEEPADDAATAAGGGPSNSLELMRELQRQRQRSKGVTLEPRGDQDLEAAAAAGEAEADHSLDSTFTSQTDGGGEVDPNMLRYIEEQMRKEGGGGGGGSSGGGGGDAAAAAAADEDGLYVTPDHLQERLLAKSAVQGKEIDDAQRWLAGIMEVPIGAEEKMEAIEQTELAKRKLMAQEAAAGRRGGGPQLSIPANFNANFHQHRRDAAQLKRDATKHLPKGPAAAAGTQLDVQGPGGTERINVANDQARLEAFRRNEGQKRRQ